MPADNARHGLVHLVGGACGVGSQIQDLLSHVLPALHAGELEEGTHTHTHTVLDCWLHVFYTMFKMLGCPSKRTQTHRYS